MTGEVTIHAPVEEVVDLVADERNEPKYNRRMPRAAKFTQGPVGSGARFIAEPKGAEAKGQMTLEVLGYDRPRRLHNLVSSSNMRVDGTVIFGAVVGGTRLRWRWDMRLVGPMRVMSPALAVVGPRWERRNGLGLKEYLESGPRATARSECEAVAPGEYRPKTIGEQ